VGAPARFDDEADIVVIGAGATGITAALAAREAGASVIVIEAENHIGDHAICQRPCGHLRSEQFQQCGPRRYRRRA
jgi:flavin-dependent dehydrogenase